MERKQIQFGQTIIANSPRIPRTWYWLLSLNNVLLRQKKTVGDPLLKNSPSRSCQYFCQKSLEFQELQTNTKSFGGLVNSVKLNTGYWLITVVVNICKTEASDSLGCIFTVWEDNMVKCRTWWWDELRTDSAISLSYRNFVFFKRKSV